MKIYIYSLKKIWNLCSIYIFLFIFTSLGIYLLTPLVLYCYKNTVHNLEKNNLFFCLLYIIIIIISNILIPLLGEFLQITQAKIQYNISKNGYSILFNYLSDIDISFFDKKELYIKIERSKIAITNSMLSLFISSTDFFGRLISIILIAYMIIKESPWILILLLIIGILQNLFLHKNINDSIDLVKINESDIRKENYYGSLFKKREYIKELHLFSVGNLLENKRKKYFNKIREENKKYNIKWTKINLSWASIMYILEGLLYLVVFSLFWITKIEASGLIFIIQSQDTFIQSFSNLIQLFPKMTKDLFYLETLYKMENTTFDKGKNSVVQIYGNREIILSKVYFKYNNRPILKDINLEIFKGETIAIVGENGCGKSTLIKLICGLLYPNSGSIINTASKIGAVFQDYAKFYTTLRENIAFGSLNKLNDEHTLKEIIKNCMGTEFTNKYNSLDIGLSPEFFENAIELSGGEWQKLAIGRCIASDADLIILDESSSALDPLSEKLHYSLLNTFFKEKTIIMVTHRLNGLLSADKIIFMKNGQIIEFGSHVDLISKKGCYFSFFNSTIKDKGIQ